MQGTSCIVPVIRQSDGWVGGRERETVRKMNVFTLLFYFSERCSDVFFDSVG